MSGRTEGGYRENGAANSLSVIANVPTKVRSNNPIFTFRVDNESDIVGTFGSAAMEGVLKAVSSHIALLADAGVGAVIASGHMIRISFSPDGAQVGGALAVACWDWVRRVCRSVPLLPIQTDQGVVHAWVSGAWGLPGGIAVSDGVWAWRFGRGLTRPRTDGASFRADMAAASTVLQALAGEGGDRGVLGVAWKPVVADNRRDVLYYQSVPQFENVGSAGFERDGVAAVQRVGFGNILDEIVADATVTELENQPDVMLSVAVSSVDMARGWWWERLAARLHAAPMIARRLVLEISETAAMGNAAEMIRFCEDARRLGCRIAIEDFGAGYASVRQLVTIAPDIVKIDRGFVRRSTNSVRDRAVLAGLTQLAAAMGAVVVADGIDTPDQARLAGEMGLHWQQGHFWGGVSTSRPWRGVWFPPPALRDAAVAALAGG